MQAAWGVIVHIASKFEILSKAGAKHSPDYFRHGSMWMQAKSGAKHSPDYCRHEPKHEFQFKDGAKHSQDGFKPEQTWNSVKGLCQALSGLLQTWVNVSASKIWCEALSTLLQTWTETWVWIQGWCKALSRWLQTWTNMKFCQRLVQCTLQITSHMKNFKCRRRLVQSTE